MVIAATAPETNPVTEPSSRFGSWRNPSHHPFGASVVQTPDASMIQNPSREPANDPPTPRRPPLPALGAHSRHHRRRARGSPHPRPRISRGGVSAGSGQGADHAGPGVQPRGDDRGLLQGRHVDFIIGDPTGDVMLEIKAKGTLEDVDVVQALSYLKASGHRVGLLLNFRSVSGSRVAGGTA